MTISEKIHRILERTREVASAEEESERAHRRHSDLLSSLIAFYSDLRPDLEEGRTYLYRDIAVTKNGAGNVEIWPTTRLDEGPLL